MPQLADYIAFGASPRGPIAVTHGARALAVLRGRDYAVVADVQDLVKDAFRHRLVLTYQALAEERSPDSLLDEIIAAVPVPRARPGEGASGVSGAALSVTARTPAKPGPGPLPDQLLRALDLTVVRRVEGLLSGDHRAHVLGRGTELAQVRPYVPGEDDVRDIDWNVTARTGEPHVRVQLAERVLVSWIVLDTSASMTFGTADRRKADVAEGVALALGHIASRHGNRLGLLTFGGGKAGHASTASGPDGARRAPARPPRRAGGTPRGATSLGEALRRAGAIARQRAFVAVVSDFRGPRRTTAPPAARSGRPS